MSRSVNVVILCEDRQHEAFARRFLALAGRGTRVQRVEISPKGRGSGEQFVCARFARELAFYRSRQHRVEQALVVVVDGDAKDALARETQLAEIVMKAGQEPRKASERVAIFVPARNIETWLAYLDGQDVDETTPYPRLPRERECRRHVDALHKMCRHGALRQPAPPSLAVACEEWKRLGTPSRVGS
ncbi:MAG: hypothetical protein GX174_10700 [Lentisphaerae bacterium]|jgi:hypothetical protein|nr:hypothetical protein [Lentisphaerota bacterium]